MPACTRRLPPLSADVRHPSGANPRKAWKAARRAIFDSAVCGTWSNDNFISEPSDMGTFCSLGDVQRSVANADAAANSARMFEFRPDGQVRAVAACAAAAREEHVLRAVQSVTHHTQAQ